MTRARSVAEEHDHASDPTAYWDAVARRNDAAAPPLWRLHADLATLALLERWLPAGRSRRILKTDLYDETCSDGLVPALAARASHVAGIDVSPVIAAEPSLARKAAAEPTCSMVTFSCSGAMAENCLR